MSRFVGAAEAARLLGVQKATLYAYVSRGLIDGASPSTAGRRCTPSTTSSAWPDGAASREVAAAAVDRRADRHRRSPCLDEDGPRYRGHDVADLARRCHYEQVAELLWTGELPAPPCGGAGRTTPTSRAGRRRHGRGRRPRRAGDDRPRARRSDAGTAATTAPAAARRLLGVDARRARRAPPATGSLAARLAALLVGRPGAAPRCSIGPSCCSPTTSWRRARWPSASPARRGPARTPRSPPGWPCIEGPLHGGRQPGRLRPARRVRRGRRGGRRRAAPARRASASRATGTRSTRAATLAWRRCWRPSARSPTRTVAWPSSTTCWSRPGVRLTRQPNVDLGLAALAFVGGLPARRPAVRRRPPRRVRRPPRRGAGRAAAALPRPGPSGRLIAGRRLSPCRHQAPTQRWALRSRPWGSACLVVSRSSPSARSPPLGCRGRRVGPSHRPRSPPTASRCTPASSTPPAWPRWWRPASTAASCTPRRCRAAPDDSRSR